MANAPTPGSRAADEAVRLFLRIRIKDRTLDLVPTLTMKERFVVRAATGGLPLEAFLPQQTEREFGEDSLFVLWWVARRQNGEPNLAFAQADTEWPNDLDEGDVDVTEVDLDNEPPEDDSPEGPGPGS